MGLPGEVGIREHDQHKDHFIGRNVYSATGRKL
jgi:hypothetical protein